MPYYQSDCFTTPMTSNASDVAESHLTLPFCPSPEVACLHVMDAISHCGQASVPNTSEDHSIRVLRIECPTVLHVDSADHLPKYFLRLLRFQGFGRESRSLFVARDGSYALGGWGQAHIASSLSAMLLSGTDDKVRYIGGRRFDEDRAIGAEWRDFFHDPSQEYWVLPRLEIASSGVYPKATYTVAANMLYDSATGKLLMGEADHALSTIASFKWPCRLSDLTSGPAPLPPLASDIVSANTLEEYSNTVNTAISKFRNGSLDKVVISLRSTLSFEDGAYPMDPIDWLITVVEAVPDTKRYTIYIEPPHGESAFVCITPERLCRVEGGHVETEAVAGTWKPSEITNNDEADIKRSTEHSTVTKYIRGILSRRAHNVRVSRVDLLRLKELVHCKQMLEATVDLPDIEDGTNGDEIASLRSGHGVVEWLVRDLHPTPAVGGKPLKDAMTFIRAREPFDRGFFAAPCGVVSSNGGELAVSLRSALVERRHGSKVHVMAGAGLIDGSVPEDEWNEIRLKMRQFVGTLSDGVRPALKDPSEFPNFNTFWCAVFVDELVRLGIKHFVVCPGSRSTPLTIAVTKHPQTTHVVHTDERGAAFYALGYAKATGLPAPVIVTSGSAVANLLPAITEAHESHVPMLLLTADRPAELRDTGSNQTMNQTDIFKPYAVWTRDVAPPCESAPVRYLLSDTDYAVAQCLGQQGVVHLNMQFRENLAPEGGPVRGGQYEEMSAFHVPEDSRFTRWQMRSTEPLTRTARPPRRSIDEDRVKELICSRAVVVVVGALSSPMEAVAVDTIAEQLDCLVLADVFSGCRRECLPSLCLSSQAVVDMLELSRPTIIRMGGALISKQVQGWMSSKMGPVKEHIRVTDVPTRRHDVDWNSTIVVDATCAEFARMIDALNVTTEALTSNRLLRDRVHAISGRIEERLHAELGDECTEPNISRALATFASAQKECVVISSSMSCRNFDTFCPLRTNIPRSSCSRGVSGIDGTISTTIGYAVGCGLSTNLLIGDVAAIHDLNSVVQLANYLNGGGMVGEVRVPPVKIVVCNNNGGSMFKFVPIGKYSEEVAYDKNFRTPIEVAFAGAAEMMGLKGSTKVEGLSKMVECLGHSGLIEIVPKTSQDEDVALRRRVTGMVGEVVEDALRLHPGVKLSFIRGGTPGKAPLVLLHGWMGSAKSYSDWLACDELSSKYDIVAISLPGHGGSLPSKDSTLFDYGMSATIANLRGLVKDLFNGKPVTVCGYSLGGRVALEWARRAPGGITRLVIFAASTAVGGPAVRERRWRSDCAWAEKLESPTLDLGLFLTKWYGSGSVFADLPTRRPEEFFGQWLPSRVGSGNPAGWAKSMLAMSQAWGVDCSSVPVDRFIAGALDTKYSSMKVSLARESSDRVILPDVGHSLLWEVDCQTLIHAAML